MIFPPMAWQKLPIDQVLAFQRCKIGKKNGGRAIDRRVHHAEMLAAHATGMNRDGVRLRTFFICHGCLRVLIVRLRFDVRICLRLRGQWRLNRPRFQNRA